MTMEQKSTRKLLDYLASHATEAELLDLCLNVEDRIAVEKGRHKDLTGFLTRVTSTGKATQSTTSVGVVATPTTKILIGEGLKATSDAVVKRIRKDVATRILNHLKNGPDKPTVLANMLNMSTGKMSSIISALAGRGDVLFDGKVVSLPKPL